jgi:hypothetical protein
MRAQIRYVPEDIVLDLGQQDLGHPDGRTIMERHYRQSAQSHPAFNARRPAFVCLRHAGSSNPGLYLKRIGDQWWACHYEQSQCGSLRIPAPMSDLHKRQVDYWTRAAADAGWSAQVADAGTAGTRPDVLIRGTVDMGLEVRGHDLTAQAAVARGRKAESVKVLDVWFTNRTPAPQWAYKVPSVMENTLAWDVVPRRRTALATGLRTITPVRCALANVGRCPESGRRRCGQLHAADRPWHGLLIDDVAARVPAGDIVPMKFRRTSRTSDVLLVSPASLTLYEDLTGRAASLSFGASAETLRRSRAPGPVACRNDQTGTRTAVRCFRCHSSPAGPGGVLCLLCRLDIEASDGYQPLARGSASATDG